jgi:hypothetical protein
LPDWTHPARRIMVDNCKKLVQSEPSRFAANPLCVSAMKAKRTLPPTTTGSSTSPQLRDEPEEGTRCNRRCLKEIDRRRRIQAARHIRHAQVDAIERQRVLRCLTLLVKAIRVRVRNPQKSLVYATRIIFFAHRPFTALILRGTNEAAVRSFLEDMGMVEE